MIGAVFQMAAEFFEELKRQWSSNDHRTKGSILGRAFAEIFLAVGTGGTVAAAGHVLYRVRTS
jgi:hypothetical protein